MDIITKFIIPNIAYILVFVSICYIGTFIYMIVTKKSFTYKLKKQAKTPKALTIVK